MALFRRHKPNWQPDWQTFPGRVGESDAMLHADLAAVALAPIGGHDVRLTVRVVLGATRPDGAPRGEDAHQLYLFEDRLAGAIRRAGGHYVGRVVSAGSCLFVCQLAAAPGALKLGSGPFSPELSHVDDPEWTYVRRVFVPDPAAEQRNYNRPLVAALVARGDRSDVARPVEHSAYFGERSAASAAGAELGQAGHRVSAVPDADGCVLTISGVAALTDIDDATIAVRTIVRRHGGVYDGWGCDLVR